MSGEKISGILRRAKELLEGGGISERGAIYKAANWDFRTFWDTLRLYERSLRTDPERFNRAIAFAEKMEREKVIVSGPGTLEHEYVEGN